MNKKLHISIFWVIALVLGCLFLPTNGKAQWDVRTSGSGPGVGTVQAIAPVRCGPDTMLLAGTADGIFIDPTGRGLVGSWAPVMEGLEGERRDVTSIAVADSIVFITLRNAGIFAASFSPFNDVPCRPVWRRYDQDMNGGEVNKVIVYQGHAYAATNVGVWRIPVSVDSSLTFEENTTLATWSKVEQNVSASQMFQSNVLSIHGFEHYVFAGVHRQAAFSYNLLCQNTTSSVCFWRNATPQMIGQHITVHDITAADLDTIFPMQPSGSLPCRGVFLATGVGDNLFFAPVPARTDGLPVAIDIWYNISPSRYNSRYIQRINKVVAGNFPDAPAMIIVGMESGGILVSSDCGQTWQEANDAEQDVHTLAGATIRELTILRDSLVFVAADGGPIMGRAFGQNSTRRLRQQTATSVMEVEGDSIKHTSISLRIERGAERGILDLRLADEEKDIEITAYNLLGNKIKEVYRGEAKAGRHTYEFSTASMPVGMYVCLARGKNFRLAEKFIISR